MSCYSKEKMERNEYNNICKSHSARSDRELYRICPSKLSKRELEDLYFSLLENNIELKRTINGQQDKIRGLSTKVQRMNASQKNLHSKEMKDCCIGTKAIINEQKESITELKRANQRMADRIQMLNMRLCSAKQFFKKPAQASTSRCLRCAAAAAASYTPKKHNCLDKASEPVLKISTSSQCEETSQSMKAAQTETSEVDKETSSQTCDENKCRTLMEELKLKIVHLQDELFTVHDEYSRRISRLESEVSDVRKENVRVCAERSASDHQLRDLAQRHSDVLATCRNTQSRCADLAAQLSIEKRKVAELETQLKAANMSGKVNKTIEDHLSTTNDANVPLEETGDFAPKCVCGCPRADKDKGAAKNLKCDECGCPPHAGDSEDSDKIGSAKSYGFRGKPLVTGRGSRFSKLNKTRTTTAGAGFQDGKFSSCECPPQQKGESVFFPAENSDNVGCACPPPAPEQLSALTEDAKLVACGCLPPRESSTPTKEKKGVDCGCPAWQEVDMLLAKRQQDENFRCEKCCHKEPGFSRSSPAQTGTLPGPTIEDPRWSPTVHHEDAKMSKASDDSGYLDSNKSQDTDDLSVNKMNKELIARIVELQSQVDALKITGASELPASRRSKLTEFSETPTNSIADSAITGFEDNKLMKPDRNESTMTTVHTLGTTHPQLSISRDGSKSSTALLSREGAGRTIDEARMSEDTRVKTIQDADGNIHIADERLHSELIIIAPTVDQPAKQVSCEAVYHEPSVTIAKGNIEPARTEPAGKQKMPVIVENEPSKLELEPEAPNVAKDNIQQPYGPELNDKTKYLEPDSTVPKPALAKRPPPHHHQHSPDETVSVAESVPSNPELGFDIPRLESKNKRESISDSKKLNETPSRTSGVEMLPGKLKLPMTDAFVANQSSAAKTSEPPSPTKEDCEHCAACSFNKQCAQQSRRNSVDNIPHKTAVAKMLASKDDRHNSLQIPGPIPAEPSHKKKNVFRHFSLERKKDKNSKQKKESVSKQDLIAQKKKVIDETSATAEGPINLPDVPLIHKSQERLATLPNVSKNNLYTQSKDSIKESISTHRKRLSTRNSLVKPDIEPAPVQNISMHNYLPQSDRMLASMSPPYNREAATEMERKTDEVQTTEQQLQDQANQASTDVEAAGARRDVSVYRRASGTLCFRTLPARAHPACTCAPHHGNCRTSLYAKGPFPVTATHDTKEVQVPPEQSIKQKRTSTASEHDTYTVDKQSRGTSPDSTEFEMTYISDLPLEKEKTSPKKSRPLSPGEDKTTTTYTDSSCSPDTNYTLSEGEMPIGSTSKRRVSYDRDKHVKPMNGTITAPAEKPCEKIEAALQAVTDELAKCNTLLNTQRPSQPRQESCHSQTSVSDPSRPIALRRAVATQSIGDVYVPKCIFTLHIGTVVLSDEAVMNSRDKTLVLTWKFYDQNIAMMRMRAGRVVLFDFSTEYDIKITDDFLNYMKHEEMPIVICELDKEDHPFATCALPLREALLHTNRRADMSLALVAGPQMAEGAAADALDARDEMGVIDLWCMLRADANMLPGINLAIAQPSARVATSTAGYTRNSRVMPQILDDDHNDLELSLVKSTPVATAETTGKTYTSKDMEYMRTSNIWSGRSKPGAAGPADAHTQTPSAAPAAANRAEMLYDPSNYPPVRSRRLSGVSTVTGQSATQAEPNDDNPEHDSDIIVNEVQAKIKSPGDMRHALEQRSGQQLNEMGRVTRKSDEDVTSQAQSSLGSMRSVLARLQRRGSRNTSRGDNAQRAVIQNIKRSNIPRTSISHALVAKHAVRLALANNGSAGKNSSVPMAKEEATDMEIYRKYENISKLIGSNREQSKKSVKIVPKYMESEIEEPSRDVEDVVEEDQERTGQNLDITVLWLALNEECEAMIDPHVQRVYVAYTFLGRTGAELETPVSLPKPKHYVDKCYFNFKKTFELEDTDLLKLSHMARCRATSKMSEDERDCIVFSVVSEPPEDPLGLESCEDIGYAYLYLGDLLAYSAGSPGYTEVIPVRAAGGTSAVCGVLAVRLDGLDVVRRCLLLPSADRDLEWNS